MEKKVHTEVDICLIVEGGYPYTVGGVASWVDSFVQSFPELKFHVMALCTSTTRAEIKYPARPNVVALTNVDLDRCPKGRAPTRRDGPAIPVDVVSGADQRFRVDRDARGVPVGERAGLAEHRNDAIAVAVARLRAVVRPLEGLERVLVTVGVLESGRRGHAREPLVAAEPDRLAVAQLGPLDREAHQALRVGLLHVEREEDDIRPGDGADPHRPIRLLPHRDGLSSVARSPTTRDPTTVTGARLACISPRRRRCSTPAAGRRSLSGP